MANFALLLSLAFALNCSKEDDEDDSLISSCHVNLTSLSKTDSIRQIKACKRMPKNIWIDLENINFSGDSRLRIIPHSLFRRYNNHVPGKSFEYEVNYRDGTYQTQSQSGFTHPGHRESIFTHSFTIELTNSRVKIDRKKHSSNSQNHCIEIKKYHDSDLIKYYNKSCATARRHPKSNPSIQRELSVYGNFSNRKIYYTMKGSITGSFKINAN